MRSKITCSRIVQRKCVMNPLSELITNRDREVNLQKVTMFHNTGSVKSVHLSSYCYNQMVIVQRKIVLSNQIFDSRTANDLMVFRINLQTFRFPKLNFSISLQEINKSSEKYIGINQEKHVPRKKNNQEQRDQKLREKKTGWFSYILVFTPNYIDLP